MEIVEAKYNSLAEVYDEIVTAEESGFSNRTWDYSTPLKVISCDARIIIPFATRVNFAEQWGPQYNDSQFMTVMTREQLTNRQRLGKVKVKNGTWTYNEASIFDILAVFPIFDPLGTFLEYHVLAAEVMQP